MSGNNPTTISMGKTPTRTPGIRFYTAGGAALTDIIDSAGKVRVVAAHNGGAPDITVPTPAQVASFTECLGANTSPGCVLNCFGRVTGGAVGAIVDCPQCLLCAGPT